MGVLAVTALQHGDVWLGLVGEDRLASVAVMIGERQPGAGCGRSRRTISRVPLGQEDRSIMSVISATSPFLRSAPS